MTTADDNAQWWLVAIVGIVIFGGLAYSLYLSYTAAPY